MKCRSGCGACCIAPSISTSIPGMPDGKKAGEPCVQLTDDFKCKLFGSSERPVVCSGFLPELIVCGNKRDEALETLYRLEGMLDKI